MAGIATCRKPSAATKLGKWKVKPGQIWQIGRHRLMCGDATNPDHVRQLMAENQADLCFTSPPYSQQRAYGKEISDWDALMEGVFSNIPAHDSTQILVNLGMIHRKGEWVPYWEGWIEWMRSNGWRRFGWYVWDQGPGLPGDWNGRLAPSHEWLFHFNRKALRPQKTQTCKWAGQTNRSNGLRQKDGTISGYTHHGRPVQEFKVPDSVVRIMRHKQRGIEVTHPAVFPVELCEFWINTYPGKVYEPFSGSGSTIVAAEKTGQTCFAMELEPQYCAIALERMATLGVPSKPVCVP